MNTNNTNSDDNNLIMFPASKNFLKVDRAHDLVDSLLNEFSHMSDEDIPSYLDDRFDEVDREIEVQTYESLEAFMNRNKAQINQILNKETHVDSIQGTLDEIKEIKARIQFFLDEIDMFLPNRH